MRLVDGPALLLSTSVALVASVLVAPPVAQACSIAPGVWSTTPADGEGMPEGSTLFIRGNIDTSITFVQVDGAEASFAVDPDFPRRSFGEEAYRISPTPEVGSTVALYECYSGDPADCDDGNSWSWTVTEADTTSPAPADALEIGIYDHRDVDTYGDSCGSGVILDVSIYVSFTVPAEPEPGAARLALVQVSDAVNGREITDALLDVDPEGGSLSTRFSFADGVLTEPLAESVCIGVTLFDLAGNYAGSVQSCEPDHVGADPDQTPVDGEFNPPDEPDWDGLVDPDDIGNNGCQCRAEGSNPRGGAAALLLVLLGLRLRSRRRHG